jgi:acetoin utilization protein AcuB
MTQNVLSVRLQSGLTETAELMKRNKVRRVPVMNDQGRLTGIVTEADINRAEPSAATALSKNELTYLLDKLQIQDILPKNQELITVEADCFIEMAARLMREHRVSGLPVMEQGQLVGIITETDIFDAFIDILGVKKDHTRLDIYTEDRPGVLAEITGILAQRQINIINLVVFFDQERQQYKMIFRLEGDVAEVTEALKQRFQVESVTDNNSTLL